MAEKKRGPGRPPGSKNKASGGKASTKSTSGRKNSSKTGSKAREKAQEIQSERKADRRVIDEIWSIISIAIGVFLIVATFTDGAGKLGEMIGDCLKGLFGFMAYILPFYLIIFGILLFTGKTVSISIKSTLLLFLMLLMLSTVNSATFIEDAAVPKVNFENMKIFYTDGVTLKSGGFFGMILASWLIKWLGTAGCWIFSLVITAVCLLLIINTPVSRFITKVGNKIEERKLVKEHAYLDFDESVIEEGHQVSMKDMGKKSFDNGTALSDRKEAIKIVDGNATPYSAETHANGDGGRKRMFPSFRSKPQKPVIEKNSVLRYMKDDTLFNRENVTGSFGLEESADFGVGYGVDGIQTTNNSAGFGLTSEHISGTEFAKTEANISNEDSNVFVDIDKMSETDGADNKKLSNREAREEMLSKDEINNSKIKKYKKPPINLLEKIAGGTKTNSRLLTEKAQKLEETLRNFHVDAKVVQVTQGPTVTRYEIQPAVGVKVNSIVRLADDIALNLEAKSIRIEAPIPGKAAVGIEVENDAVTMVRIREIIDSQEFKNSKSKITFAVGKDISGKAIVADLKSMPHLLIAGSTGSGKSVCINGIIISLLYKANPDEVKLILVDPKVVELGNYNGIPHLMIPVVTDPGKAAAALNWAVSEMTDRYKKFAEEGVRDLESYNEYVRANGEDEKAMPQVVIIIDELADLMMAAPSQIEESICRLAQMARAAGMHLIVATQRPSVDVITGVIKANIPSRIAFAVSSQVDSRTILDMQGAEKLVGKGDMLFNPMGMGKPVRIQGAFISDNEVNNVIDFVKGQVEGVDYNSDILTRIEKSDSRDSDDEGDELLSDAIELVVKSGQASVSMLQRRFRIGYNRAARIMDMMETRNIVGPQDGSRPRQVLITEQELQQMKEDTEEL